MMATIRVGALWTDTLSEISDLERAALEIGCEIQIGLVIDEALCEDEAVVESDDDRLLAVYDRIRCEDLLRLAEDLYGDDLLG